MSALLINIDAQEATQQLAELEKKINLIQNPVEQEKLIKQTENVKHFLESFLQDYEKYSQGIEQLRLKIEILTEADELLAENAIYAQKIREAREEIRKILAE